MLALQTSLAQALPPSVILFNPNAALSGHIRAELVALGFRVVPHEAEAPRAALEREAAARALDPSAGVSVLATGRGVDVWLLGPPSAQPSSTHVFSASASEAAQHRLVAVRVVELLRATLLELELPDATRGEGAAEPRAEAGPAPTLPAAPPDAPAAGGLPAAGGSWLFDVGLGASSSLGAVGVTPLVAASALWRSTPAVAVGLSGVVPLGKAEVSAREGTASLETWRVTAGSRIQLLADGPLRPLVGGGIGLVWFRVEGVDAASLYRVASEQLLVPSAHVELGVHWELSRKWALSSSSSPSFALAKPAVEFAGREVLVLGRPLVVWTLRVEYRAFPESRRD